MDCPNVKRYMYQSLEGPLPSDPEVCRSSWSLPVDPTDRASRYETMPFHRWAAAMTGKSTCFWTHSAAIWWAMDNTAQQTI